MSKPAKDRVASFRIPLNVDQAVAQSLEDQPVSGVNSANKWYRKLALDYAAGRLVYKNPDDAKADPVFLESNALLDELPAETPA